MHRNHAELAKTERAIGFDVADDRSADAMRALGLYIGAPADGAPHPFPEPAPFVISRESRTQIIEIANAPFLRPDLDSIPSGLAFIREKNYPISGTMAQRIRCRAWRWPPAGSIRKLDASRISLKTPSNREPATVPLAAISGA